MAKESSNLIDVFKHSKCEICGRVELADEPGLLGLTIINSRSVCTNCAEMEGLKAFVSDQIMRRNNKDATDNIVAAIYRYKTKWLQSLKQSDAVEAKKVCYCGSLRVALDEFKKKEYEAVLRGEIALLPCCMFVDIQREYGAESDYKQKADELHKRKIDICDEVFVLNVGGYIGESTRSEIDYAVKIGKPIKYLEPL